MHILLHCKDVLTKQLVWQLYSTNWTFYIKPSLSEANNWIQHSSLSICNISTTCHNQQILSIIFTVLLT